MARTRSSHAPVRIIKDEPFANRKNSNKSNKEIMCEKVKEAVEDENKASKEYEDIVVNAFLAGETGIANAVKMISEQEKTHKEFFKEILQGC